MTHEKHTFYCHIQINVHSLHHELYVTYLCYLEHNKLLGNIKPPKGAGLYRAEVAFNFASKFLIHIIKSTFY